MLKALIIALMYCANLFANNSGKFKKTLAAASVHVNAKARNKESWFCSSGGVILTQIKQGVQA